MKNSTVIRVFYTGFIEESRFHDISSVNKNKFFLSAKADDQGIPIGKSADLALGAKDKRSFNNYVEQILPNFDPLIPLSGQLRTFYMMPTLYHVTKRGLSTDPLTPSSCPRSY